MFLPLSEPVLPEPLLTCLAGVGDGAREAFGWKSPFGHQGQGFLQPFQLTTALGLCWATKSSPSSQLPFEFQPHHESSEILRWFLGADFAVQDSHRGQGWLRSLLVLKDALLLTQPTSLFLWSSPSKKNQILKSSRRVPALSSRGNRKGCHILAEENPFQAVCSFHVLQAPLAQGLLLWDFAFRLHTGRESRSSSVLGLYCQILDFFLK